MPIKNNKPNDFHILLNQFSPLIIIFYGINEPVKHILRFYLFLKGKYNNICAQKFICPELRTIGFFSGGITTRYLLEKKIPTDWVTKDNYIARAIIADSVVFSCSLLLSGIIGNFFIGQKFTEASMVGGKAAAFGIAMYELINMLKYASNCSGFSSFLPESLQNLLGYNTSIPSSSLDIAYGTMQEAMVCYLVSPDRTDYENPPLPLPTLLAYNRDTYTTAEHYPIRPSVVTHTQPRFG